MEDEFVPTTQPLLRVQDVSKILNLGCSKVWQLIYYEGLPILRFGRAVRVSPSSLQEWLEQREKHSESA
jgi:excisionase family DNA binding protein